MDSVRDMLDKKVVDRKGAHGGVEHHSACRFAGGHPNVLEFGKTWAGPIGCSVRPNVWP